jgi:LPXTG-motif cell wall-anchored protein
MERSNTMKRLILSILAIFLLTAGVAVAQSANTTAPGPTQQREPGQTSNNLPNPGNPQTDLSQQGQTQPAPATETTGTTGTTTGTTTLQNETETEEAEGMDVDVDTGARAEGAVDVDVSSTADTDTDASGIDETGTDTTTTGTETDTMTGTETDTGTLPDTASELPLLVLAGLLALASAFMVRLSRRNA